MSKRDMEITLRRDSRGGSVLRGPVRATESAFRDRHRFIWLVHGYNVSEDEARREYRELERNLLSYSGALLNDTCYVFWPGDARMVIGRSLVYPFRVGVARAAAELFVEYLERRRVTEIVIVGHSLGCRMVLETLARASLESSVRLILMAAAVPVRLLQPGGTLRGALDRAENTVLFSGSDPVLNSAFPVGQGLADRFVGDLWPEAVGSRGNPNDGIWDHRFEMRAFRHGDYWQSRETARVIASVLGVWRWHHIIIRKGPIRRWTPAREDTPPRPAVQRRRLGGE